MIVHSAEDGSIPVPDMTALIARLEAAEGPDRALDREIGLRIDGWYETVDSHGECLMANGDRYPDHPASEYPSFTESLDAALALAERVLEPVQGLGLLHAVIDLVGGNGLPSHRIAPLFCAAILKAKAQGEGG